MVACQQARAEPHLSVRRRQSRYDVFAIALWAEQVLSLSADSPKFPSFAVAAVISRATHGSVVLSASFLKDALKKTHVSVFRAHTPINEAHLCARSLRQCFLTGVADKSDRFSRASVFFFCDALLILLLFVAQPTGSASRRTRTPRRRRGRATTWSSTAKPSVC